jgi:hypothetical protein
VQARAIAMVMTVALLLAACGSEPSTDAGSSPSPDTRVTNSPGDPTGPIKGGAQKVEPRPGTDDPRPSAFAKVKVLDDRTLRVFFYQGVAPCSVLDRVEVEYGTETIGITLFVGSQPTAEDVACIELAVYNYVDVELDEPIDGRRIVDGAS